jgi:hypothetical protein
MEKWEKREWNAKRLAEKSKNVELKPKKSKSTTNSKLVEGGKDVKRTKKNNNG